MIAALFALALMAGSDDPTPYDVTPEGIQLPAGDTFGDNWHINVRAEGGRTHNAHFEAKCVDRDSCEGHPYRLAQYIGEDFIPWEVIFNAHENLCVEWVQISEYNEHYGEGGQPPVCIEEPPPTTEPPTSPPTVTPPTQTVTLPPVTTTLPPVTTTLPPQTVTLPPQTVTAPATTYVQEVIKETPQDVPRYVNAGSEGEGEGMPSEVIYGLLGALLATTAFGFGGWAWARRKS